MITERLDFKAKCERCYMIIFNNPFYILGATTRDNRKRIIELCEEKSLLADSDKCFQARNALTTPQKRLEAEMDWLPGCSPKRVNDLLKYLRDLENGIVEEQIEITTLDPLPRLNFLVNIFSYKGYDDYIEIAQDILDLDETYESIEIDQVLKTINGDRATSDFPQIELTYKIEEQLSRIRRNIKTIVSDKLCLLCFEEYADLVETIADQCISNGDYITGVVIDDLIDDYSLKIESKIENCKQSIITLIESIENDERFENIDDKLDVLNDQVKAWDALARPLQISAKDKGTHHSDSVEIARQIRSLAIMLHNDFDKTSEAIKLNYMLKLFFAELPEFAEIVDEDVETLERINEEKADEEAEFEESLKHNRMDRIYKVTAPSDRLYIPPFCTCCMKPTQSTEKISSSTSETERKLFTNVTTTRTVSMDLPLCEECKAHRKKAKSKKKILILVPAIITGISVPIVASWLELYSSNFWGSLFALALISFFALGFLIRLPQLGREHSTTENSVTMGGVGMSGNSVVYIFTNWRYAKLFSLANDVTFFQIERRNKAKSNLLLRAIDDPGFQLIISLCIAAVIAIGVSLFIGSLNGDTSDSNYNSTSDVSAPEEVTSYDSNSAEDQINSLEQDIESRKSEIQSMESDLQSLESDLDYYEQLFNESNSQEDADQYNETLDEYNSLYSDYEVAIDEYNQKVNEYNTLIAQ